MTKIQTQCFIVFRVKRIERCVVARLLSHRQQKKFAASCLKIKSDWEGRKKICKWIPSQLQNVFVSLPYTKDSSVNVVSWSVTVHPRNWAQGNSLIWFAVMSFFMQFDCWLPCQAIIELLLIARAVTQRASTFHWPVGARPQFQAFITLCKSSCIIWANSNESSSRNRSFVVSDLDMTIAPLLITQRIDRTKKEIHSANPVETKRRFNRSSSRVYLYFTFVLSQRPLMKRWRRAQVCEIIKNNFSTQSSRC